MAGFNLGKLAARSHAMDEAAWERHANPLSVYSRMLTLPFLAAAPFLRVWIGLWWLAPFLLLCVWLWLNPRLFPKPKHTTSWASRAVLGERVWLARFTHPIPTHHTAMAMKLQLVSGLGTFSCVLGCFALQPWPALLGVCLIYAGKLWFLDRMVWLYEDTLREPNAPPAYRAWLY